MLSLTQFKNLLFSAPNLFNPFIVYLFRRVTSNVLGESYLEKYYRDIVEKLDELIHKDSGFRVFDGLRYQLEPNDHGAASGTANFSSIKTLIGTGVSGLKNCCQKIYEIVNNDQEIGWLVGDGIKNSVFNDFKSKTYDDNFKSTFINDLLEEFQHVDPKFSLLSYMRKYLRHTLSGFLDSPLPIP